MFLVLWEFEVKSGCVESFQCAYGATGGWARLFARDPNFVETRLLKDFSAQNKFLTVDIWKSRTSYESFKEHNRDAYAAIDRSLESLTMHEKHLGSFENGEG